MIQCPPRFSQTAVCLPVTSVFFPSFSWMVPWKVLLVQAEDSEKEARENGARLIVMDPRLTPIARTADLFIPVRSGGDIGVRAVNEEGVVGFVPVRVAEDEQTFMWVTGIPDSARVIVQGQDFVREGQKVDTVVAGDVATTTR